MTEATCLNEKKDVLNYLGVDKIPSNIDMFYDLSYDLSTYIFEYRTKHNYTQKQFAEFLGVRKLMVSKLESGNYNISLQSICDVMAKLNTKVKIQFSDVISGKCKKKDIDWNKLDLHNVNDYDTFGKLKSKNVD